MGVEKRKAHRYKVNLPCELLVEGNLLCAAKIIDLSVIGAQVYLEKDELTIPKGVNPILSPACRSGVKIKFGLEKVTPFLIDAKVVWQKEHEGKNYLGLEFTNPAVNDKEKIRKYMDDLKYINRDGYTM